MLIILGLPPQPPWVEQKSQTPETNSHVSWACDYQARLPCVSFLSQLYLNTKYLNFLSSHERKLGRERH